MDSRIKHLLPALRRNRPSPNVSINSRQPQTCNLNCVLACGEDEIGIDLGHIIVLRLDTAQQKSLPYSSRFTVYNARRQIRKCGRKKKRKEKKDVK